MEYREQPVRMKDLIQSVLLAWRQIILFALIGTLLLSAFAFYRVKGANEVPSRTPRVNLTDKQIELATAAAQTSSAEAVRVSKRIKFLNARVESIGDQLANSVYLRIDEEAQNIASFDVTFHLHEQALPTAQTATQRRHELLMNYVGVANSDNFFKAIELRTNGRIQAIWLRELISFEIAQADSIRVKVTADNEKTAQELADNVRDFFRYEMKGNILSVISHDVALTDLQWETVKNPNIPYARQQLNDELTTLFVELDAKKMEIDDIVALYIDNMIADMVEETEPPPAVRTSRYVLKFAVLGALLGALIAMAWVVFKVTSSLVIRYPDEFSKEQNLLFIGRVASEQDVKEKKFLPGIDRLISRLFNEKAEAVAVTALVSIIQGLKTDDQPTAFIARNKKMPSQLIAAVDNAVPVDLRNEEGVSALKGAHDVILIVQPGVTNGHDAVRDLEIANSMGKRILGIISQEDLQDSR